MSAISGVARTAAITAGVTGVVAAGAALYAANGEGPAAQIASSYTAWQGHSIGLMSAASLGAVLAFRGHFWFNMRPGSALGLGAGVVAGLVGGALVGKALDRHVLNRQWYEDAERDTDREVDRFREYMRGLGTAEEALTPIPVTSNRLLQNAAFLPKDFGGQQIVIGRHANGASYAESPDVIYHEYGHRVIEHYAPELPHSGEAGAINEGLADTFAALLDEDDWTIGEGGGGTPLRRLDDPASIPIRGAEPGVHYPKHRSEIIHTQADGGGVHLNSTIVGHASYLMAQELGREAVGRLYVNVLQYADLSEGTFEQLAREARSGAVRLWGLNSPGYAAVDRAWSQVGYPSAGGAFLGAIPAPAPVDPLVERMLATRIGQSGSVTR